MSPANCIGKKPQHNFSWDSSNKSCHLKHRLLDWFTYSQDNILSLALTNMRNHISWTLKNAFSPGHCNLKAARVFGLKKKKITVHKSAYNSNHYVWLQTKSSFSQQSYSTAVAMTVCWRTGNCWASRPSNLLDNSCTSFSCLFPPSQTNSALQTARRASTSSHSILSHKQAEEHLEPGVPFEAHSEANLRGDTLHTVRSYMGRNFRDWSPKVEELSEWEQESCSEEPLRLKKLVQQQDIPEPAIWTAGVLVLGDFYFQKWPYSFCQFFLNTLNFHETETQDNMFTLF